jgi:hypothetical protein
MAAGLGFKTFTTGEVLTAGDVNGYLMQGINVFASTAARDAAITSPQEGQFAFTKDTNSLWYYDGAAWVASGATGDIEGVTAGIGISGGGTSGTVTVTNSMATAIDAKGDLVPGTGADTFARLAVGANDTILTADSTAATGMKWAAAGGSGASFSLVTTLTLAGSASYTATGLGSYNQLYCVLETVSSDASDLITYTFNSDTGNNYNYQYSSVYQNGNTFSTANVYLSSSQSSGTNKQYIGSQGSDDGQYLDGYIHYIGTKSTGPKVGFQLFAWNAGTHSNYNGPAQYVGTSAISSMTFTSSGALDGGTIKIYGSAV